MIVPFARGPVRAYVRPFLKEWSVYVLQEDFNGYWARIINPDGRVQNLPSAGGHGEHSPGWLYVQN